MLRAGAVLVLVDVNAAVGRFENSFDEWLVKECGTSRIEVLPLAVGGFRGRPVGGATIGKTDAEAPAGDGINLRVAGRHAPLA